MSLTLTELALFATDLADSPERWGHLVHHSDDARVYEQIWDDDDVNAWVICWSEDQDTGFHDHDESAAGIAVIAGAVREERLRFSSPPSARVVGPGETFTVPREAIHRVLHTGDGPAITIHAYSPPLNRTGTYRIGADGELERIPQSAEEELRAPAAA
jgi:mannose-6-phosphate isomerase-like protein (cupin superfamily)